MAMATEKVSYEVAAMAYGAMIQYEILLRVKDFRSWQDRNDAMEVVLSRMGWTKEEVETESFVRLAKKQAKRKEAKA